MTTQIDDFPETGENLRWYILHTYSGQEDRVKKALDSRRENLDIQDRIVQVVVPRRDRSVFQGRGAQGGNEKAVSGLCPGADEYGR